MLTGLAIGLFLVADLALLQFGLPLIYGPAVSPGGLQIRLFRRIPLRTVPFQEIRSVSIARWTAAFRFDLSRWTNRPLWIHGCVVVSIKNARGMLLTPDHPAAFVRELRDRLPSTEQPEQR